MLPFSGRKIKTHNFESMPSRQRLLLIYGRTTWSVGFLQRSYSAKPMIGFSKVCKGAWLILLRSWLAIHSEGTVIVRRRYSLYMENVTYGQKPNYRWLNVHWKSGLDELYGLLAIYLFGFLVVPDGSGLTVFSSSNLIVCISVTELNCT